MQSFVRKLFGLYAGEGAQAFRFVRLAILWAFGSSCLETLSDGLFLEKVGADSLPQVYLSVAFGMILVSSLVLYSLKLTSPYRILMSAMSFGVLICVGAALIIPLSPPDWFWLALKISSRMFFAVMIACSWTFTDQYHDLQDAKRVYSIYSASYFFGTVLSGSAIHFCLQWIGFSGLLFGAATAILLSMTQAWSIAHKTVAIHDDSTEGIFSSSKDSFRSLFQMIRKSNFTISLLLLSLFIQLLLTVTEFNYMETFGKSFSHLPEEHITSFLGKCRALISACNILFGLFFYSRFLRRAGMTNAILVTPLFFFSVYAGWVFQDGLGFAIFALIAADGVLFTIEDNCFNLLSNAVPTQLKSKVRIINDSFFEPIGMLLSSLLLFGMQSQSRWLGASLALFAIAIAFLIRSSYGKAILINLKDNAIHFEKKIKDWISQMGKREGKQARKEILKALRSSSEETQLLAIDSLLDLEDASLLPEILSQTKKLGTLAKIRLLKLLDQSPFGAHTLVIETIDSWAHRDDSPELSKRAFLYLAKRGLTHPEKVEEDLDHPDPFFKGAAILTMKKTKKAQSPELSAIHRTVANKKLDLMLKSARIDEVSMALEILRESNAASSAERALPFLQHEAILVKRSAAQTIAHLADPSLSRLAPRLIEELVCQRDPLVRAHLLDAIGEMGNSSTLRELLLVSVRFRPNERRKAEEAIIRMGLKTVPLLLSMTQEIALPDRARILAGKVLARLALPQLQANLVEILDIEIERAYFYFYFAHTIQKEYPLYDLEILQTALLTGYQSVIDFIIHLLGAAGALEDPDLIVRALHSRNQKIHSHAVESLEKTCNARIFRMIAPLVDDLPLEEKMDACIRWRKDVPDLSLSELLGKLDDSPSLFDKIVAIRLKAKLQTPNWREELRELMQHEGETFHQYAYELLQT